MILQNKGIAYLIVLFCFRCSLSYKFPMFYFQIKKFNVHIYNYQVAVIAVLNILFPQAPGERARLYFLLAWFHAVVQERLRYAPLGWSKKYEFNESDLRVACDTLDTWIETVAMV